MANRVKEDEKNEKIIRGLLKLPANRRCINCNSLGPQYVCTNFWTFICTNCSGIHREFTHRAKSISMAKFTSQEVAALQEGGNEHAREIYFKDWDPHRHSFPDSSNIDRLRTFIKHVYVDRRYAGERPGDKIERMKGDKDNNNGKQRSESSRSGSRSPPYQDHSSPNYGSSNDDRSFRYNSGDRSPGYDQGDNKRSPAHFEMVDGKSRNGSQYRRFEDQRLPDAPKPDGRSPELQKQVGKLSPPMVRPIKDILGDDVPQLQVGDTPKSNGVKVLGDSAQLKSSLSSSSVGSTDSNSVQLKGSYMESLIDFSVDPNPSVVKAPEKSMPPQTIPDNANGGDWAAFDISGQQIIEPLATNANQLVSALEQLSVSGPTPSGRTLTYSSEVGSSPEIGGNIPTIQQQQPLVFPPVGNLPTNQSINAPAVEASNNLIWTPSPQGQGSLTIPTLNPAGRLPPVATKPLKETTAGVSSPPSSAQINSNGRKELPADIFTSLYPTTPASAPSWQRGPYPGMGYTIQYHTAMVMPSFTPTSKPVNPFDIASDPAPMATLPSMTPPATLLRSSSFDAPSPSWVPTQQFAYASGPFAISQVPNSTPQQIANAMMPVGNQIVMSDTSGSTFATSSFGPNPSLRYNQPSTPNSFTQVGGNPFG